MKRHGRAHPGSMRVPACLCGAVGIKDEQFDAYYCPTDGAWLEKRCDDAECMFCPGRPLRKAVSA